MISRYMHYPDEDIQVHPPNVWWHEFFEIHITYSRFLTCILDFEDLGNDHQTPSRLRPSSVEAQLTSSTMSLYSSQFFILNLLADFEYLL